MLVMHFGHRVPEMHSHDATGYYAAIRPASAASHPYAVRHRSHNDYTPGCGYPAGAHRLRFALQASSSAH
jgi:hypothetical protein